MSDLLIEKLNNLQLAYTNVLEKAVADLSSENYHLIIDEINVFWYTNRDLVELVLNYIIPNKTCYVFTGGTFLDVDDYEHYPFISLGNYHIVDDPICRYSRVIKALPDSDYADILRKQILVTAEDNIKILKNYNNNIKILPIRFLFDIDTNLINTGCEQFFLSMFKSELQSLDDYTMKFHDLGSVISDLKDGVHDKIHFSTDEDFSSNERVIDRYRNFINTTTLPFKSNQSEVISFYSTIFMYLYQALEIIMVAAQYSFVPYVRDNTYFQYILLESQCFAEDPSLQQIIFQSFVAYVMHSIYDKEMVKGILFSDYVDVIRTTNFSERIYEDLQINGNTHKNPSIKNLAQVLTDRFEEVFSNLYANHMNDR